MPATGKQGPVGTLGASPPPHQETSLLASIADTVQQLIADNGYVAVFLLMMLGCMCIPIPSEVVMAFAGALCAPAFAATVFGSPEAALALEWVVVWGIAGSMAGSLAAYWLGVWGGRPAIDRWGRYLLLRPHEVDRAHAWFEHRGEAVVFLGRLVPLIRAFVSLPAGIAKMDLGKFTLFTFLGVLPWCLAIAAAGKALGTRWSTLETYFLPISIAVAAILLGAVIWWVAKRSGRGRVTADHLDRVREANEGSGPPSPGPTA